MAYGTGTGTGTMGGPRSYRKLYETCPLTPPMGCRKAATSTPGRNTDAFMVTDVVASTLPFNINSQRDSSASCHSPTRKVAQVAGYRHKLSPLSVKRTHGNQPHITA